MPLPADTAMIATVPRYKKRTHTRMLLEKKKIWLRGEDLNL